MSYSLIHSQTVFGFNDIIYEKNGKILSKDFIDSNYEFVNLFGKQLLDEKNIKPFIGINAYMLKDKDDSIKVTYSEQSYKELLDIVEKYKQYYLKTFGEVIDIHFTYCSAMIGDFKVDEYYTFT